MKPAQMEFRLTYEGPLKAATRDNSRMRDKHVIRKEFHKQLAELWRVQRPLTDIGYPSFLKSFSGRYARGGFNFLPLINKPFNLVCSLDILFLRRESPGELIKHGGDLDNRLKTLFDALRIPEINDELTDFSPSQEEDPFFCLLEDDALITNFQVTTDRLLTPLKSEQHPNEVFLAIKINTKLTGTEGFYSADFSAL